MGTSQLIGEVAMTNAVATRVRDVGEAIGPKAREFREAVGPKVRELGDAVGPKVREIGETVKPRVQRARRKVGYWIAGEEPPKRRRWPVLAAVGVGAAVTFFFDPVSGKRRRAVTRDWVMARFRGVGSRAERMGRGIGARAGGFRERIRHRDTERLPENDATLAHKVESEVFQGLDIPAGKINVNAENGVVFLRGTVMRPSQIIEIERRVWDVKGVRGVENLLHPEGTPAPAR